MEQPIWGEPRSCGTYIGGPSDLANGHREPHDLQLPPYKLPHNNFHKNCPALIKTHIYTRPASLAAAGVGLGCGGGVLECGGWVRAGGGVAEE